MMNILNDETLQLFGYAINSLKPSSCKVVVWQCSHCGTKKHKKFREACKNTLCIDCSNKINANTNIELRSDKVKKWHETHTHPLLGTKRPQNVIDAIKNRDCI
jgi:NOL1/NOP2/fmu family ribosome biogenesis protein